MTTPAGRALNLTAHAYGRAATRGGGRVAAADLVSELKLEAAAGVLAAIPLSVLSKALGDSPPSRLVDFVTYAAAAGPVATMLCIGLWNLVGRRSFSVPSHEGRYDHPLFVSITRLSWGAAILVAAAIVGAQGG